MKVLIACEFSGVVREAFKLKGHDVWSVDLLPTETPGNHYQGSIFNCEHYLGELDNFDLLIAHPPCTYLCSSGLHWNKRQPERALKTEMALDFVRQLMRLPINKKCIENPVGCISSQIRKPDQYIQPYDFGHDASKKTGLWLEGLPLLQPTKQIEPRIVGDKKRWGNQTDSGQNKLGPSDTRWKERSITYQGIADAMAIQWGS